MGTLLPAGPHLSNGCFQRRAWESSGQGRRRRRGGRRWEGTALALRAGGGYGRLEQLRLGGQGREPTHTHTLTAFRIGTNKELNFKRDCGLRHRSWTMLRIRIRDPVPFWSVPRSKISICTNVADPKLSVGSGTYKNTRFGSGFESGSHLIRPQIR